MTSSGATDTVICVSCFLVGALSMLVAVVVKNWLVSRSRD